MNSTVPLPEPDCRGVHFDGYSSDALRIYAGAVSAADNAALRKQLAAYKVILAGMDRRNIAQGKEYGLLMHRAADTDGERAANAILTDDVEKLRADNDVLTANLTVTMNQLELEEEDNDVLTKRVKVLEDALSQAADSIERWGDFKWDLAGDIIAARAALEKP